jgi:hypothetical protein
MSDPPEWFKEFSPQHPPSMLSWGASLIGGQGKAELLTLASDLAFSFSDK